MEQQEIDARKRANLSKGYKKKKTGRPYFDKEALVIWSLIVRQRAGGCELCHKDAEHDRFGRMVKNLDAHHLVGRNNYLHRYSLNNGMALCKSCHAFNRDWSPHYDLNSVSGFIEEFSTAEHLKYRYDWWVQEGHKKHQPTEDAEYHYHRLLDVYISMLDGDSLFPCELY